MDITNYLKPVVTPDDSSDECTEKETSDPSPPVSPEPTKRKRGQRGRGKKNKSYFCSSAAIPTATSMPDDSVFKTFLLKSKKSDVVIQPRGTNEIIRVIQAIQSSKFKIAVRGGGLSYSAGYLAERENTVHLRVE